MSSPRTPLCPVCLDPFATTTSASVPVLLLCGHSFHRSCVAAIPLHPPSPPAGHDHDSDVGKGKATMPSLPTAMKGGVGAEDVCGGGLVIRCPLCRAGTPGPASSLKPNYVLMEAIDAAGGVRKVRCEVDGCGSVATIHCAFCVADVCDAHDKSIHVISIHCMHHRVPIDKKVPPPPRCPQHAKVVKFYCHDDNVMLCTLCKDPDVGSHAGHRIHLLPDAAATMRVALRVAIDQTKEKVGSLEQRCDELADDVAIVMRSREDAMQLVTSSIDRMHRLLDDRKQVLLQQLDAAAKEKLDGLTRRRDALACDVTTGRAACERASLILQQPHDIPIITCHPPLHRQLREVRGVDGNEAADRPGNAAVLEATLDVIGLDHVMSHIGCVVTEIDPPIVRKCERTADELLLEWSDDANAAMHVTVAGYEVEVTSAVGEERLGYRAGQRVGGLQLSAMECPGPLSIRMRSVGKYGALGEWSPIYHRFVYSGTDYDGNGVLHWLGTRRRQGAWTNPVHTQHIALSSSSIALGSLAMLTCDRVANFITRDAPQSWVQMEFRSLRVQPTHYTVGYYVDGTMNIPRNWRLQGSNDGVNWDTLRDHRNDTTLTAVKLSHTFDVRAGGRYYTHFRLYQFGPSSDGLHYFGVSGIEMYGMVLEM